MDRDVPIAIFRLNYRAGTARSTLAGVENLLVFDMSGMIQAKRAFVDFAGFCSHCLAVAGVVEWQTQRT